VVFVDWHVPMGTPPGTYTGTATVVASDGRKEDLPVVLTVWEFEIPAEKTIATAFGIIEGWIRHYHGGPDGEPGPDFEDIVDRYHVAMHEHRIDPTHVSGPVDFTFDPDGNLQPIDWRAYDEAVRPFLDGSLFPDGVGVTRFDVHKFRPGKGTGEMTGEQYVQAAAAFAEHLDEM